MATLIGRKPTRRILRALTVVGRAIGQAHDQQGELAAALWEAAAARHPAPDLPGLRGVLVEAEGELASMRRVVADLRGQLDVERHLG